MKRSIEFTFATILVAQMMCVSHAEEQKLWRSAGQSISIDSLPKHVRAEQGKLTLFADFKDIREVESLGQSIVLYLVNRTDKERSFEAQDGDLYIKLEAKEMQDVWYRAQGHQYSWCGNSYFPIKLKPGHFYKFFGTYPSEGEERVIRYRSYVNEGLVSNSGPGRVSSEAIKQCKFDRLAISAGDYDLVTDILLKKIEVPPLIGYRNKPRHIALHALSRFPVEKRVPIYEQIAKDKDTQLAVQAISLLNDLKKTSASP